MSQSYLEEYLEDGFAAIAMLFLIVIVSVLPLIASPILISSVVLGWVLHKLRK